MIEVLDFWKRLPKSKQRGRGRPEDNKSYQLLLSQVNDPLVSNKLGYFEKTAKKLNNVLVNFQTNFPMMPLKVYLAWCIEEGQLWA